MKLDSAYFNKIRIDAGEAARPEPAQRACEMPGCDAAGTHKAPKGRAPEGEYFWFCLDHVREYNKSYNYFSGMNDAAIQAFQRTRSIGHRPTWQMGVNAKARRSAAPRRGRAEFGWTGGAQDPFRLFGEGFQARGAEPERRKVHNMEARSLQHARAGHVGHCRGNQGALQAPGQTPPPRRQWRGPLAGRPPARDHPGLQLSEERRFLLMPIRRLATGPGPDARPKRICV